jgi:NAD(P)-dependent dehydrogenase (short-subunit alcohol dehydrogenase family)
VTAPVFDLFSLAGRVAAVTGASSGIGRTIAETLAEAGASMVLVGRQKSNLEEVEEHITSRGGRCASVTADLSERDEVARASGLCTVAFGSPDILVNAAGINVRPPLRSLTNEQWDETLAVNLTAPFLLGQHLAPAMAQRGYGRIINFGSQAAFRAFNNSGAYGVSKAGVVALTRAQAEEWSVHGVCCNTVIPGFVPTAMNEAIFADPERTASLAARTMGGRLGTVDDFRGVAVFLASAASAHITGQVIFVDGGFSVT